MYKRNNFKVEHNTYFHCHRNETYKKHCTANYNSQDDKLIVRVNIVCLCVLAFACCAESGCSCGPQHPQQALCGDNTFGEYCICF